MRIFQLFIFKQKIDTYHKFLSGIVAQKYAILRERELDS